MDPPSSSPQVPLVSLGMTLSFWNAFVFFGNKMRLYVECDTIKRLLHKRIQHVRRMMQ